MNPFFCFSMACATVTIVGGSAFIFNFYLSLISKNQYLSLTSSAIACLTLPYASSDSGSVGMQTKT